MAALDGVRGLAVLGVMLFHFVTGIQAAPHPVPLINRLHLWQVWRLPYAGWIGVDLFFVLSGFLITGILVDSKGAPGYFRRFYLRRVLRIFPLYYGILAVVFGCCRCSSRHLPWAPGFRRARAGSGYTARIC